MARLKPAAKGLIVAVVIGAAGFGLNSYLDSRPAVAEESVQEIPEVTIPVKAAKEPQVQHSAPAQVQQEQPSAPVVEESSNAGLDALLNHKK